MCGLEGKGAAGNPKEAARIDWEALVALLKKYRVVAGPLGQSARHGKHLMRP